MLRRTIALALAGLAVAAPPALAHSQWNALMTYGADTASRTAGGCSLTPGWYQSLIVTCDSRHTATLVYVFAIRHSGHGHGGIQGQPTSGVSLRRWGHGHADVHSSVKVAGDTLRVTVTVSDGTIQLNSVNVGYYTH
jgi:hypothetical protein